MKMLFAVMLIAGTVFAQDRPTRGGFTEVFATSTTVAAKFVGEGTKDISIAHLSGADTVIIYTVIGDTAASKWRKRILILPGFTDNTQVKAAYDTLYFKASANTPSVQLRVTFR